MTATAEQTPELVRELVHAGVDVHEVHAQERTLEDAFFALTGGDVKQANDDVVTRRLMRDEEALS